jgi:hypothetical protein
MHLEGLDTCHNPRDLRGPFYVSPQNLRGAEIRKPGVSTSLSRNGGRGIKSLNKFTALIVLRVADLVSKVITLVRNAFKTSQNKFPFALDSNPTPELIYPDLFSRGLAGSDLLSLFVVLLRIFKMILVHLSDDDFNFLSIHFVRRPHVPTHVDREVPGRK